MLAPARCRPPSINHGQRLEALRHRPPAGSFVAPSGWHGIPRGQMTQEHLKQSRGRPVFAAGGSIPSEPVFSASTASERIGIRAAGVDGWEVVPAIGPAALLRLPSPGRSCHSRGDPWRPSGDEAYQDRSMPIGIEASCRLTLPRLFRPRHQCKYEFVNYVRPRLSCGTAEAWQVCGGSSAISRKALRVCSRRI